MGWGKGGRGTRTSCRYDQCCYRVKHIRALKQNLDRKRVSVAIPGAHAVKNRHFPAGRVYRRRSQAALLQGRVPSLDLRRGVCCFGRGGRHSDQGRRRRGETKRRAYRREEKKRKDGRGERRGGRERERGREGGVREGRKAEKKGGGKEGKGGRKVTEGRSPYPCTGF